MVLAWWETFIRFATGVGQCWLLHLGTATGLGLARRVQGAGFPDADEKSIRLAGKLYCIVVRYRSVCDGAAQHIG